MAFLDLTTSLEARGEAEKAEALITSKSRRSGEKNRCAVSVRLLVYRGYCSRVPRIELLADVWGCRLDNQKYLRMSMSMCVRPSWPGCTISALAPDDLLCIGSPQKARFQRTPPGETHACHEWWVELLSLPAMGGETPELTAPVRQ